MKVRGPDRSSGCGSCPFARNGQPALPVPGEGPEKPLWIVVGEGPGSNERAQGRPFVGQSGKLLQRALDTNRAEREALWVTNALLCLEGTTAIRLGNGRLKRIDHIVKSRYSGTVATVADGFLSLRRVIGWHANARGPREMRRISYRFAPMAGHGRVNSVLTEDHPVLTRDGWIPAAEVNGGVIATGDYAPVGRALQIAYATLLGDGTLQRGSLVVSHAVDQQDYGLAKARALSGLGVTVSTWPARGTWQPKFVFRTAAGSWGHATRALFYPNGKKHLPPEVLEHADALFFAVWYMDDGSLALRPGKRPRAEICAVSLSNDQLNAALMRMRAIFGMGSDACVYRGRIRLGKYATEVFCRGVAGFVPEIMSYKLPPEMRGRYDAETFAPSPVVPFFDHAESVCVVPRRKKEASLVYCIDVEETHNFLTSTTVVHNCTPEGAGDAQKEAARVACAPRLRAELAQFPGRPVLLLGSLAAHALQIEEPDGADGGPIETADPDAISSSDFVEPEPEDVITGLLKNIKISKIAGSLFVRDLDGTGPRMAIPTIHPAAILRGGAGGEMNARALDLLAWNLIADVGKVHRLATGRQEIFAETIEGEHEDPARASALVFKVLAECCAMGVLALDLETTALRPHEAQIRAVGLGHAGRSVCVTWDVLPPLAREALGRVLADPVVVKVIHNRLYDVPVLEWCGFPVRGPVRCTLLGHHVIFPGLPHDLQRAATQFFAIPPWKAEFRGGEETPASLVRYCAIDTLACARLDQVERRFIAEGGLDRAYDMYQSNAAVATRAMLTGIPLDLAENDRLDALFAKVVEESMAELLRSAGDPAIRENLFRQVAMEQAKRARKSDAPDYPSRIVQRVKELESCVSCDGAGARPVAVNARCECEHPVGKHVNGPCAWSRFVKGRPEPEGCACASYRPRMKPCAACGGMGHPPFEWNPHTPDHVIGLLRARRVPLYQETKTGKVSTARLVLEALRRFPEVDRLLLFRDADKMLSTFVRKVRISAVARPDGTWRLYPRVKVHMITARWAYEDPMFQNWPRANKRRGRPNLRAQIVAPPGQIIAGFDFEKQEARVIGLLSGDEYLCKHVSKLHEVLAREVWPPVQGFRCGASSWVKGRDRETLEGCPATGPDPGWRCGQHPEHTPYPDVIAGFMGKKRDPELYDFVKRTEYGAFYEGSIETLHRNLLKDDPTVKEADVARAVAVIKRKMPKVAAWQAMKRAQVAQAPHRLRSFLFGVQRIWPLGNASPTEVANWDVQTTGSELMAEGFSRLVAWFEARYSAAAAEVSYPAFPNGFRILLQVHDAAYFLGPEGGAASMREAIEACFPQEYTNPENGVTMPFPVEVKMGRSLADV